MRPKCTTRERAARGSDKLARDAKLGARAQQRVGEDRIDLCLRPDPNRVRLPFETRRHQAGAYNQAVEPG